MEVSPPEGRQCALCKNTYTLNLFRLDSNSCRYCELGLVAPISSVSESPRNGVSSTSTFELEEVLETPSTIEKEENEDVFLEP